MKSKEELSALKEEAENVNRKLPEMTKEEMMQAVGGLDPDLSREFVSEQPELKNGLPPCSCPGAQIPRCSRVPLY